MKVVDITPKNLYKVLNDFKTHKKNNTLTPEFCTNEILSSTNNPKVIHDMLTTIKALPLSEQEKYKDTILSIFILREQPEDVQKLGLELAKAHNFDNILSKLMKPPYAIYSGHNKKADNYENIISKFEDQYVYPNADNNTYIISNKNRNEARAYNRNFMLIDSLKAQELYHAAFYECTNMPPHIDLSLCDEVCFLETDLLDLKELKLKYDVRLELLGCQNFPPHLLQKCSYIQIDRNTNIENITLKKGASLYLRNITTPPKYVDLSKASKFQCDYETKLDETILHFSSPAQLIDITPQTYSDYFINIGNAQSITFDKPILPSPFACHNHLSCESYDLSNFASIIIPQYNCIYFKKTKMPQKINFTHCKEVKFADDCDFSKLTSITFSDKEQYEKSKLAEYLPDSSNIEINFTTKEEPKKTQSTTSSIFKRIFSR